MSSVQRKETREQGGQDRFNYVGMCTTSLHCRMRSHRQGQKYKISSNPLYRHDQDQHQGENQVYTAKVLSKERSILPLSIIESLYIEAQVEGTSMNDRNENGRGGGLVRLTAIRE